MEKGEAVDKKSSLYEYTDAVCLCVSVQCLEGDLRTHYWWANSKRRREETKYKHVR